MQNYFIENPVISLAFIVVVAIILVVMSIISVRNLGFEKIRHIVYLAFVEAENNFNHGDNSAKFEYVVDTAKQYLPSPFRFFITEELLRKVIQEWFVLCKDLLDDGKLNNSQED